MNERAGARRRLFTPQWQDVHEAVWTSSPELRTLFINLLTHIELGWRSYRPLQTWVERYAERARKNDGYADLLIFIDDLTDLFLYLAHAVGHLIAGWPDSLEKAAHRPENLDGWVETIRRTLGVLRVTSNDATLPKGYRTVVANVTGKLEARQWAATMAVLLTEVGELIPDEGDQSAGATRNPNVENADTAVAAAHLRRIRERLRLLGPRALSSGELLVLLLENHIPLELDSATKLLGDFSPAPSDPQALRRMMGMSLTALSATSGLGVSRASAVLAALDLGRRAIEEGRAENDQFHTPEEVVNYLYPSMGTLTHETFRVLLLGWELDLRAELEIRTHQIWEPGGFVNLHEVFRSAIVSGAAGVILVQNHPRGGAMPTTADRKLTAHLRSGCIALGIGLYEHIIIAKRKFYSASQAGTLPAFWSA